MLKPFWWLFWFKLKCKIRWFMLCRCLPLNDMYSFRLSHDFVCFEKSSESNTRRHRLDDGEFHIYISHFYFYLKWSQFMENSVKIRIQHCSTASIQLASYFICAAKLFLFYFHLSYIHSSQLQNVNIFIRFLPFVFYSSFFLAIKTNVWKLKYVRFFSMRWIYVENLLCKPIELDSFLCKSVQSGFWHFNHTHRDTKQVIPMQIEFRERANKRMGERERDREATIHYVQLIEPCSCVSERMSKRMSEFHCNTETYSTDCSAAVR